ncbi:unnamed protein product [Pleuronectes platessa]|uniref:Uncharacterized protein n=1 Tax=Pleuronectes platessa TaxID=8262 RepID=A0A9N7VJN6_PLEPL|nr:unnamed protein product [Pleuronectes platessa]
MSKDGDDIFYSADALNVLVQMREGEQGMKTVGVKDGKRRTGWRGLKEILREEEITELKRNMKGCCGADCSLATLASLPHFSSCQPAAPARFGCAERGRGGQRVRGRQEEGARQQASSDLRGVVAKQQQRRRRRRRRNRERV